MEDKTLFAILIGFVVMFVGALIIFLIPKIKAILPKKKKKKKKDKKPKGEEPFKRPVLLKPDASKPSEKKEEPKKEEEKELVMSFPPIKSRAAQPTDSKTRTITTRSTRTVDIGDDFDEIRNFLDATEFKNEKPKTPSVNADLSKTTGSMLRSSLTGTARDARRDYPSYTPKTQSTPFNYSRNKSYATHNSSNYLDLDADEKDIINQLRNLSPDMKKLLISDILSKRKSDDI